MDVVVTGVFDYETTRCVHCIEDTNQPHKHTAVCFVSRETSINVGDKAFVTRYKYQDGWYTKLRKG